MSLWSKAKKLVNKAAKYLPAIAQAIPSSKGLATAAGTLQTVAGVLQGGGVMPPAGLPGRGVSTGVVPMSIAASSSFPAFPSPGGGGTPGLVKTGFPVLAAGAGALARSAPAIVAGGRALLARVSPRVAKALGWATVGGLVYDAAGNLQGKAATRRMNPLNPRAARRAIRRVKAVRKLCHKLESALPKQKAARCGHSHFHRHK